MASEDFEEYCSFESGQPRSGDVSREISICSSIDAEREVKVVLLGESGVGKSSLTHKFVTGYFRDDLVSTIGASFLTKTIHVKQPTKFNIWDTAGQEKYRALAALYYRGVDCAIIVYDITDRNSFEQVKSYWISELLAHCEQGRDVKIVIVGNKSDLNEQRKVSPDDGRVLAELHHAMFFETSVKTGINVSEIFESLAMALPLTDYSRQTSTSDIYKLDLRAKKKASKKCC